MPDSKAVIEATKSVDMAEKMVEVSRRVMQSHFLEARKANEEEAAREILRELVIKAQTQPPNCHRMVACPTQSG